MEEVWATEPGSPSATMLPGRLGLQRWWVGGGLKKRRAILGVLLLWMLYQFHCFEKCVVMFEIACVT